MGNTLKKFVLVIFLVLAVCLTGCADVRYRRIFDKSGSIIDEVVISIDKEAIEANDAETLYQEVKKDFTDYAGAVSQWIKDNFAGMYIEDASVETYIRQGITTSVIEKTESPTSYVFGFVTQFDTIEHFVYFYGLNNYEEFDVVETLGLHNFEGVTGFDIEDYGPFISENVTNQYTKDETPLFTTGYIWSSNNVYDNFKLMEKSDAITYLDYYCSRVSTLTDTAYTADDVKQYVNVTQVFETNDDRIFGNSDKVYADPELRGYTVYEWNLNDDMGKTIEIQRNLPVSYAWIMLALILTFAFTIALFVIYYTKKRQVNKLEGNNGQK